MVYADITLINAGDMELVKRHMIDQDEVKQMNVWMLANSGAYMMAINEGIQEQLRLSFVEKRKLTMADGTVREFDVLGPLMVKFSNRTATCNALLLEGDNEPLLGVIPMEEMDVIIHPQRHELVVHPDHPDYALLRL